MPVVRPFRAVRYDEAVAGPLKGKRLPSLDSGVHFAFAWLAFNPDSEIFAPEGADALKRP